MLFTSHASTLLLLLSASLSQAAPFASTNGTNGPTATIDSGVVIGTQTSLAATNGTQKTVNQYLGVRFAASPTRFSPPQTATPWSSPLNVTQRGPACIQAFDYPQASANFSIAAFNTPAPAESEDCLNLNVFVPAGAEKANSSLAVMFWIYGGSLQFGWAGNAGYDGSSFAANQNVIIVTTNYRTNVFGFPGALSMPATQRNLGYLDQRFALQWVQRNIRSFGGDPNKVTIFGESAGSFSVDALVTSFNRSTKPPFYAAIMESGQSSVSPLPINNGSQWTALIAALNCTSSNSTSSNGTSNNSPYNNGTNSNSTAADIACARAAPASLLKQIEQTNALSFGASADNYTFLAQPNRARAAGQTYPVPILTGSNSDEGSIFTFTDTNTNAFLSGLGLPNSSISTIKSFYPLNSTTAGGNRISTDTDQIEALYTDFIFQCPCAIVANTSSAANLSIPTWRYFYNGTFPAITPIPGMNLSNFGAYHSSEIPLVFGTYGTYPGGNSSQQLMRLSEYMQTSWATFAKNPTAGPGWQNASSGYVQVLGGANGFATGGNSSLFKGSTAGALDGGRCELWRPVYQAVDGA